MPAATNPSPAAVSLAATRATRTPLRSARTPTRLPAISRSPSSLVRGYLPEHLRHSPCRGGLACWARGGPGRVHALGVQAVQQAAQGEAWRDSDEEVGQEFVSQGVHRDR